MNIIYDESVSVSQFCRAYPDHDKLQGHPFKKVESLEELSKLAFRVLKLGPAAAKVPWVIFVHADGASEKSAQLHAWIDDLSCQEGLGQKLGNALYVFTFDESVSWTRFLTRIDAK